MVKKALRFIGEEILNDIEGVIQEFAHGKRARRGRNGAFKPHKVRTARQPRRHKQVLTMNGKNWKKWVAEMHETMTPAQAAKAIEVTAKYQRFSKR